MSPHKDHKDHLRQVRIAACFTQQMVAVYAGVSVALVRAYEADPDSVADVEKRAALRRIYNVLDGRAA